MPLLDYRERQVGSTAAQSTDEQPAEERLRRSIVRLVFAWFILLVLEGSVRKWLLPQYSQYIYFIRDPLTLVIYVLAVRNGAFKPLNPFLAGGVLIGLAAIPLAVAQNLASQDSHLLMFAVYGWRNYFWYIPFAFVIATQFRQKDLYAFCKITCIALVLATPLAVAQFWSSPQSKLNVGSAEDEALQFANLRSANGHIRPAGPFTSILGMSELTASTAAFALMCWILGRRDRPLSPPLLIASALAVAASLAVSGSRTMFVHVGLVVASAVLSGVLMKRPERMARATTIPLLLTIAFGLLFPIVFPEGYATIVARWTEAHNSEAAVGVGGLFDRFLVQLFDFYHIFAKVPLIGYGLGLGGNAAAILKSTTVDNSPIPYVESDWSRHMVDLGPVLGFLFIAYRVAFTIWFGREATRATRRTAHPLPILLFGYVGITLLQQQIAGNGVVNGFGWLYVGLGMAACRLKVAAEVAHTSSTRPTTVSTRPPNLMT